MTRAPTAVALVALAYLVGCRDRSQETVDASVIYTVVARDLIINVREQGAVDAARNTDIASQLDGTTKLIYLVEQGKVVKAGDPLAALDTSGIEEKRASQAMVVARAEAAYEQASKNLAILEKELQAARNTAESRLKIAELRVEKLIGRPRATADGDAESVAGTNADMMPKLHQLIEESLPGGPIATLGESGIVRSIRDLVASDAAMRYEMGELANQILQSIDDIRLSCADLALAEDTLMHSRILIEKGYITRNKLDRDEIDHQRQLSRVTVACNNLQLLVNYTLPETKIALDQEVENGRLGLESVIAANEARRVREAAELRASRSEYEFAKGQLENLERQIDNGTITSPVAGLVVHWTESPGRRSRIRMGMDVTKGQVLIVLPDVSEMVATVMVHEAQIGSVEKGQRALVRLDAFPGEEFTGRVTDVSTLPDTRWSNQEMKVYGVTVALEVENDDGRIRPGMTAAVEINVGVLRDVVVVPMPAVKRRGEDRYVWKVGGSGPIATRVTLGRSNLTHVEVLRGPSPGDRVYLVEPPGSNLPAVAAEPADASATSTDASVEEVRR